MALKLSASRPEHAVIGQLCMEFLYALDHSDTSEMGNLFQVCGDTAVVSLV